MDLFEHRRQQDLATQAPLADRMRPRTLDEFSGQEHIIGPGRLLRRAIEADQLSSLVFYGPPGTGKTTLARIIANTTDAHFIAINAVLAGVKDIRAAVSEATERRGLYGQRTILFVDEVHRFNKAQQDALLPWVENGTVVLIGATTENPYFEVNKALVSRSRIFQLRPLGPDDLRQIARAVLADAERGYGGRAVVLTDEALDHLVDVAGGDARAVLNALELAVETTPADDDGSVTITLEVAEESIQRRAVLYDKEGDVHFDTVSAFIKSLRGSDPDASLYWLARMIYAGEDPRFVFRRMLILAAEDVGLADPQAVAVVAACAQAFDYVGLPEGQFHLAEAALYLATAPKSNSALAYFDALAAVESERVDDVPSHLKDANRDREGFGHGEGYRYPHAYRDHWAAQQYLPAALQGRVFYDPSDQGREGQVRSLVLRRRDAQLAAMLDDDGLGPAEILTHSGDRAAADRDRWLARAELDASGRLAALRDRLFDAAMAPRHGRVLVVGDRTGLLTWEALRRVPEGGVWSLAPDETAAEALRSGARGLRESDRPVVMVGALLEVPDLLQIRGEDVTFEAIVGRNALAGGDAGAVALLLGSLLARSGRLGLAEADRGASSRPSSLLAGSGLPATTLDRLLAAEARAYGPAGESDRTAAEVAAHLTRAGLADVASETEVASGELVVSRALVERWLGPGARYAEACASELSTDEVRAVRSALLAQVGRRLAWVTATVFARGRSPA
jgi:putative ATPase